MFKFFGVMDRVRFAIAAAIRLGLFVGCFVGFPFFLKFVAEASGCRSVGGACGAMALVISTAIKPLVTIIFLSSFVGICLRRTRDTGLPAWIGLAVPLLFLIDYPFLTYVGAHWSLAFSHGVLGLRPPWFAGAALLLIIVLCIWPGSTKLMRDEIQRPTENSLLAFWASPLAVICTLILASALASVALRPDITPVALVLNLATFFPTIALYFLLLWAIYSVVKLRSAASLVLLMVTVLPFVHWSYRNWAITTDNKKADSFSVDAKTIEQWPSAIMVESRTQQPGIWTIPGVEWHLTKSSRGGFERINNRGTSTAIDALPNEYLLLKIVPENSFFTPESVGTTFELRVISPNGNELISRHSHKYNRQLSSWPVLTPAGWMYNPKSSGLEEQQRAVRAFLEKTAKSSPS